ncbi:hypothetical protein B0H13DRAFT_2651797, partial [Mycena leptocephala]
MQVFRRRAVASTDSALFVSQRNQKKKTLTLLNVKIRNEVLPLRDRVNTGVLARDLATRTLLLARGVAAAAAIVLSVNDHGCLVTRDAGDDVAPALVVVNADGQDECSPPLEETKRRLPEVPDEGILRTGDSGMGSHSSSVPYSTTRQWTALLGSVWKTRTVIVYGPPTFELEPDELLVLDVWLGRWSFGSGLWSSGRGVRLA